MTSPTPTVPPQLLLDRFYQNATKNPQKTAFSFVASGVDGGRIVKSLTYKELVVETSALATRLIHDAGLKRGDR